MENVCIHVRFSPLMKHISENNSKCCLEIVPLVTYIENIDKIKWKHKNDEIEYTVPMNYKIIIRKLDPNKDALKMYYSCVDLLPSILSNVNLDTGAIYRVISDNIVFNKEQNGCLALTNMPTNNIKLNQMDYFLKSSKPTDSNNSPISIHLSDSLLTSNDMSDKFKTGSVQTEKYEAEEKGLFLETINTTYIDKSTSTNVLQLNKIILKTTINQKYPKQDQNNLPAAYTKSTCEKDNLRLNEKTSLISKELDIFKRINNRNTIGYKIPQSHFSHIIQDSFDEEMIISNIRIKPHVRVAKFVEKMEKEIMPLKIVLNNILRKCSSLGLNKSIATKNDLLLDEHGLKKEQNHNRVVYSIVFD